MKIYRYESIGSTSTEATQLLLQGVRPPFVVTAKTQTAGRGSGSRTWKSPAGNLYLSLALTCRKDEVGPLPLKVAVLLAHWMQERVKLTPTLKWPNDLLLDGKKLAGILCEASWQPGNVSCDVIVGIGINVNNTPELESDYQATCLRTASSKEWELESLLDSLLLFWEQKEPKWRNKELYLAAYRTLHLPPGQVLQDTVYPHDLYSFEAIDSEGCLVVRNINDTSSRSIVTAQHTLRWQL
ncbi:MAG: biotin--[acetyl-CoA-carboxylase] ligase [Deltaproteobacteria bacterium]|nr:biotin--[acetyl-CoA-carboxylase] ligase [Deltaproteobacteria bacterium]